MNKFIYTTFSASLIFFSLQALAEDLVVYARSQTISHLDVGEKGYSRGDSVFRTGTLHFEENGPAVGNSYSKATIESIDGDKKSDVRYFTAEGILPDGSIYIMDFTVVTKGEVIAGAGHKHTGIILGGTGKYSGIRGTYDVSIYSGDNTKSKFVYRIIR
jgi:hypothetical protein